MTRCQPKKADAFSVPYPGRVEAQMTPHAVRCRSHTSHLELISPRLRAGADSAVRSKDQTAPVKLLFSRSGVTGPALHTNIVGTGPLPSHVHLTAGESCEQPLVRTRISVTLQSRTACSCT